MNEFLNNLKLQDTSKKVEFFFILMLIPIAIILYCKDIEWTELFPLSLEKVCLINWGLLFVLLFIFTLFTLLFFKKEKLKYLFKAPDYQSITNRYFWRLVITSLLLIISLILALVVDLKISTYHKLYTWICLISLFLLSIYSYKSNLASYLKRRLENIPHNFVRTIATEQEYFNVAIILAIVTIISLTLLMNNLSNEDLGSTILDISYTMIGVFFSVLIYFKIEDKTKSLSDYMNKFIRILEDSKMGDKIYIIGPTLFVGQEFHRSLHEKYKKCLFDRIGEMQFIIANLNFAQNQLYDSSKSNDSEKRFSKNQKEIDKCVIDIKECGKSTSINKTGDYKKISNKFNTALKKFEKLLDSYSNKEEKGLFTFHEIYVPFRNSDIDQASLEFNISHHCKLINFYNELMKRIHTADCTIESKFNHLDWKYYDNPDITSEKKSSKGYSNFFAVANIDQGDYYIGQFIVTNNKVHEFHGTSFKNVNISIQMDSMLDGFIKQHLYNKQDGANIV